MFPGCTHISSSWEGADNLHVAPVDDQIQMPLDYMLPLVEKIHPNLDNKITWMLLEGENNCEIMNMIGDPELLRWI
ncbi:polyadenylate-binding protein 1A-like [Ictalurus furcatus]|uniref:polyadenylate-binding protein 1A-like n=1 Tax=Ictalurus furcatus TaxID=66913 RepID=UPI0023505B25|nr:polyadenylate-binding protein 1A-like [Ictalurus furcatus]